MSSTKNRGQWIPVFVVACAMAGTHKKEFKKCYEDRLRTSSDYAACLGALKSCGRLEEVVHFQTLMDAVPSRRAKDGTREVLWSA